MKPSKAIGKIERAYAAGFVDGEGCITILPAHGKNCFVQITVAQVDVRPLLWLKERWGGGVSMRPARANHRACGILLLTTRNAARFLRDVSPYLQVKREQAAIAIAFQDAIRKDRYPRPDAYYDAQRSLMNQIRKLNQAYRWHKQFEVLRADA